MWNGATSMKDGLRGLINDENKLKSYIDNALTPMVKELSNKVALGAWEIMNEPEGSVAINSDGNPCFDTSILQGSGAGWTGENIPMANFLKFFNLQIAAIKKQMVPRRLIEAAAEDFKCCNKGNHGPATQAIGFR